MFYTDFIDSTSAFVKQTLEGAECGHDWWHISRVWKLAVHIAQTEQVDRLTVELAALLHDIADPKFHNNDELLGSRIAGDFLHSIGVDEECVRHVQAIIDNVSFKGGNELQQFHSPELDVVQDADRLDAIGAIGIARTFHYGGYRNRELYNPDCKPQMHMTKEEYRNSTAPTINHFYEKLLLLKDRMNTQTGRRMAEARHRFMEEYLRRFMDEWEGIA